MGQWGDEERHRARRASRLRTATVCCVLGLLSPAATAGADEAGSLEGLSTARQQLALARERAERSLAPHQPGSGHTKQHMQQVLNIVEGKGGKDFNDTVENPGDGAGVVRRMTEGEETVQKEHVNPEIRQAIAQARLLVEEAIVHAKQSIQGASVQETHKHAALTAGLLLAADGDATTESPVTGSLAYAIERAPTMARP